MVVVDPADPDTLYVASGETDSTAEVVFRSSDRGAHWTQVLEIDSEALGIRGLAVADGVIYVQTFTRDHIFLHPTLPDRVYARTSQQVWGARF